MAELEELETLLALLEMAAGQDMRECCPAVAAQYQSRRAAAGPTPLALPLAPGPGPWAMRMPLGLGRWARWRSSA